MIQFIVENFQSIKKAKIEVRGFTLIIGQSNQGKSACLRALQAAINNRFRAGQVRHGEENATIKIKYSDSPDILIVQRPQSGGSPKMKLGDKIFTKLSRTVPQDIVQFHNYGTLKVGEDGYSLNFHEQFQKPLLLEYSQKKVMDILSASKGIDDLNLAKEALSSKRAENRGAISSVDVILSENNKKLSEYKRDISLLEADINKLKELYEDYKSLQDKLNALNEFKSVYNSLCEVIAKNKIIVSIVSSLQEVLGLEMTKSFAESIIPTLNELTKYGREEYYLTEIVTKLGKMKVDQDNIAHLNNLKINLDNIATLQFRRSELEDFVENNVCPICKNKITHGLSETV